MSEGTIGLLVLFAVAVISAAAWHWVLRSFPAATLLATVTAVLVFQAAAYAHLGYLDPFFMVAVATSSVLCLAVALFVGWVALIIRRRRESEAHAL
jgi:hypothetical protein